MKSDNKAIKTYTVEVDHTSDNTKITWKLNGRTHCEHGPAIWWQDGTYDFYLRGKWLPLEVWQSKTHRIWNLETKRSTRARGASLKVFLVTECDINGDRKPICTFDCITKVDEFILKNETDHTWFEWHEVERR